MFELFRKFLYRDHQNDGLNFGPEFPQPVLEPALINPATGEMMIGGIGGVDTSGNPFGVDFSGMTNNSDYSDSYHSSDNTCSSSSASHDSWNNNFSGIDSSF